MSVQLTDAQRKFLTDKNFAHIATINKDGSPQVSPVWVDFDGTSIIVNSEDKRLKVRNLKRDPRVSVSVQNAVNPYEYIEIRGRVTGITDKGGDAGIDKLAKKDLDQDKSPFHKPGDVRVVIRIAPEHVAGM